MTTKHCPICKQTYLKRWFPSSPYTLDKMPWCMMCCAFRWAQEWHEWAAFKKWSKYNDNEAHTDTDA